MPPYNPFFTDNITFINPIGLVFTAVMGLLVLMLPRRYAILPILGLICYMTMGMRLMIGGFNFTMIRLLLLFCWMRLILRGELRSLKLNELDKAILWFTLASIVTHTFLLGYDGFKYKLGQGYDALGFYFFFRFLFRDWDDVIQMAKMTAVLLVPLALEMIAEKVTLRNTFAAFGGVSPDVILRDGTPRAQGPFGHPILAGTFGATLMPLMVALWWQGRRFRLFAVLGVIASMAIASLTGSSGPILSAGFGILALALWPQRRKMRWLRWGIGLTLITLNIVMKVPVWWLLARFSVFDASTGYHRALLVDRCIAHFSDWWLYGTTDYPNWGYYLFDRTNHFVYLATDGGLLTVVLFFVILTRCFRSVGVGTRDLTEHDDQGAARFVWALGAALMVHCASFLSVTYFDQNMVSWYLLLALIASVHGIRHHSRPEANVDAVAAEQSAIAENPLAAWLANRSVRST